MTTLVIKTAKVFQPLLERHRYKGAHGGRGSGKSQFFADGVVELCVHRPGTRVVCVREVQRSLKESVKRLIEDKINVFKLGGMFRVLTDSIITPGNGIILFQGMQDHTAESIKSLEGFNVAYVEEAQTLTERSLEMLRPTIRTTQYSEDPMAELWFSWNPRHSSDPVDALLRGEHLPPDAVVIRTSYKDNPFFPPELEEERAFDQEHRAARYAHVWDGEYEPTAIGAIWSREIIHRNRRKEAPKLNRILVAIDPAISSEKDSNETGIIVTALGEDARGYVIGDFSCKGTPQQWAERAVAAYDLHEADAIVAEVNQGGDMVEHTIRSVRPNIKVIKVRATRGKHVRAEPISALYALDKISHVGAYPVLESQMCLMTPSGYDGEGSPDQCLVAGTMITTRRGDVPIEAVKIGDEALTRRGWRRVLAASCTNPKARVITVKMMDGRELTGTENHPVMTIDGFQTMDALVWGDRLFPIEELHSWSKETLFGVTAFCSSAIQTVRAFLLGDIFTRGRTNAKVQERCIAISGKSTTDQSPKAGRFIIKMAILSTTAQIIWNWYRVGSTANYTRNYMTKSSRSAVAPISMLSGIWPLSGMGARLVENGTVLTARRLGKVAHGWIKNVRNVAPHILPVGQAADFVRVDASTGKPSGNVAITRTSFVRFAGRGSQDEEINHNQHAPVLVVGNYENAKPQSVFNLTIEGENEYFANGVLVHNCDAMVWGFTELFPKMTKRGQIKGNRPSHANNRYNVHRPHARSNRRGKA